VGEILLSSHIITKMIYLNQNQYQNVSGSCTRNTDLVNPYFLWSMEHKLSGRVYNFIPYEVPYITDYKPSYDLFNIGVVFTSPQFLTGATQENQTNVHLIPGEYFLTVYSQVSPSNINPEYTEQIVFQTLVNVIGTNQNVPTTYTGEDDVFIIYDPENEN
jgi:hypothetical protein